MAAISQESKASWPYFVPTWLHAAGYYFEGLFPFLEEYETAAALAVWLLVIIPIRKRLISVSRAAVLVLLPYVPGVLWSLWTLFSSS